MKKLLKKDIVSSPLAIACLLQMSKEEFYAYKLRRKQENKPNYYLQSLKEIEEITGHKIINTIQGAEPIGPKHLTDIMIIAPASGNTMTKLANDIIDTPAVMAAKSHLRNENPLVIAPSTNNGLSGNAMNIAKLLNMRNYYFVPFKQDNPITKPRSVVFDSEYIIPTLELALEGKQIQPILMQL